MTYEEASAYFDSIASGGMNYDLTNIRELCRRLGDPQDELRFVHIAGTNGKGSVLYYLSSILKASGFKVGRFCSPAVFHRLETICIGDKPIAKADYARLASLLKNHADAMEAEGFAPPSAFEMETALAFLFFLEKEADVIVLEAGMGGKSDATNIIKNTELAIITSISIDHTQYLGQTLSDIACHKAGIIKPGCDVLCAKLESDARAILEKHCESQDAPLYFSPMGKIKHHKRGKFDRHTLAFPQCFSYDDCQDLKISLAGDHQLKNALLAIDAIRILEKRSFIASKSAVKKGLAATRVPGRFQVLRVNPPFIIDGAHNPESAGALAETLKNYFTNKRIIYIMGVLRDKDCRAIISETCGQAEHIITVGTKGPRGLDALTLAKEAAACHAGVTAADSLEEAVELARLLAAKDAVTVAFGSFSLLSEITQILKKETKPVKAYGRQKQD